MENNIRLEYTLKSFIIEHCSEDLEFQPGTKFTYSNSGYYILGAIIEKVTDKKLNQVLKENILIPLGMVNSGCDDYYTVLEKRSSAYEKIDNGYRKAGYWDRTAAFAAGSMYSTVEYLFLWNQALYAVNLSQYSRLKHII